MVPNVNLIYLSTHAEMDKIAFETESLDDSGEHQHHIHQNRLKEQICKELTIPSVSSRFIEYNWHGEENTLPWNNSHNVAFDPRLVNLVIPEVEMATMFIRGANRRIALAFPPTYNGEQPNLYIMCPVKGNDNIRVLNNGDCKLFDGLEKVFSFESFVSLPRLKDSRAKGSLTFPRSDILVIPDSTTEYF